MLTYVINTSENKVFDSSLMFELAGYNKIRWMHCLLQDIEKCAEQISQKQNLLGADRFRVAVLVDFYSYDKIRRPYGRIDYRSDDGVDISIYRACIEVFLTDTLIRYLEKKDLFAADYEVYYVQDELSNPVYLQTDGLSQVRLVMKGDRLAPEKPEQETAEETKNEGETEAEPCETEGETGEAKAEKGPLYESFSLYCTPQVTLHYDLADYPYGTLEMTDGQFWDAVCHRNNNKSLIRRHQYVTTFSGGAAKAALDVFSLSLHLICIYERELSETDEGDMTVSPVDPDLLRDVLEYALNSVNSAKEVAKKNGIKYYSLEQQGIIEEVKPEPPRPSEESAIRTEMVALPNEDKSAVDSDSGEGLYTKIMEYTGSSTAIAERNRKEFDEIMGKYLTARDETRESDVEEEFLGLKQGGYLTMTDKCPSKEEYELLTGRKQRTISAIFEKALAADFITVDYTDERKKAGEEFAEYQKAKACLRRSLGGDIALYLLSVLAMLIPYAVLQLSSYRVGFVELLMLALNVLGLFTGLFIAAVILQILPHMRRLRAKKKALGNLYLRCLAKNRYSLSDTRKRYEDYLLTIEREKYELRQMKRLYEYNIQNYRNISVHHEMLERLEDCISAILNNLDVEPVMEPIEAIENEFDVGRPIHSRENKVYRVFPLETIERMFRKKGSDS